MTALLDWEDALVGDPLFDVAMVSTFHPPRRLAAFMAGYGLTAPSRDEQRLIAAYFLRVALSKTVHRSVSASRIGLDGHRRICASIAVSKTSNAVAVTLMRIVVTGATGFLGSYLVADLVRTRP